MSVPCSTSSLTIRYHNGAEVDLPAQQACADAMRDALPWRTFRWYNGQLHYPGTYWSATEAAHVIYESRLELSRLLKIFR
jgi:hypothetical protein